MRVGIVGVDKFKLKGYESEAETCIINILMSYDHPTLVSGRSPKGGIDTIAEQLAIDMDLKTDIKPPKHDHWDCGRDCYGYKARNDDIARISEVLYCITVPDVKHCEYCKTIHRQNGGCYTISIAKNKYRVNTHLIVLDKKNSGIFKFI